MLVCVIQSPLGNRTTTAQDYNSVFVSLLISLSSALYSSVGHRRPLHFRYFLLNPFHHLLSTANRYNAVIRHLPFNSTRTVEPDVADNRHNV